ncbi:MAG: sulfatase [Phycisphaeraceae bacterium]
MLILCVSIALALSVAAQPDAPERPNVLFIIADDLSAEALGCYDNAQVQTPNIDRLAERGVRFEHAYCQYPVCGPARAALMSGLYPQQNGVTSNSHKDILSTSLGDHPTLPEHFKNNGYTTARCGKIYHMRVPGDITAGVHGPDHPASWTERYSFKAPEQWTPGKAYQTCNTPLKPDPDRDIHYNLGYGPAFFIVEDPTYGAVQHDVKATNKAIELLGKYKQDSKPFFLAVGYVRPHVPLVAPAAYFERYAVDETTLPEQIENDLDDVPEIGWGRIGSRFGPDTDDKRRQTLRAYYASVSFMDAQVGRLLDALDKQGLTDNTIVVFLSDHGYHLGEHDKWQKMSLHEESVQIPLIVAGPGIEPFDTRDLIVSTVDIYPSLVELAGLTKPRTDNLPGLGWEMVCKGVRGGITSMTKNGHLIRTKRWAYMRYKDGSEELYDMVRDPKQFTNLAKDRGLRMRIQDLRELLDRHLETTGASKP